AAIARYRALRQVRAGSLGLLEEALPEASVPDFKAVRADLRQPRAILGHRDVKADATGLVPEGAIGLQIDDGDRGAVDGDVGDDRLRQQRHEEPEGPHTARKQQPVL